MWAALCYDDLAIHVSVKRTANDTTQVCVAPPRVEGNSHTIPLAEWNCSRQDSVFHVWGAGSCYGESVGGGEPTLIGRSSVARAGCVQPLDVERNRITDMGIDCLTVALARVVMVVYSGEIVSLR